jgi:DNA-binding CsgD family transcriptional regulator
MIRPVRPDGTIETGGIFVPIVRRRVIDRVASAATQRVVLIVAPAGYGKSVALRQYLETLAEPAIRYDVLPDNTGLLGFLRGFADAVAEMAPDARSTLAGAYEKNAVSASPGTDLAMWMHSHLKSFRGVIAIDDLQVAQEDREVTRFVTSMIERTKGRVQWFIATRATTGLPIGTWLAYGESDLAVDEHDLKFSVEEAREAARAFRLSVRDDELFELLNLTDGWATAMTFALRSSTRSVDLRNISSMTREMVYRYLAEQVYHTLDEREQRLIETAALLPDVDIQVLVAAGFDRAAAMIADLRARVAFIHEDEPGRFRLHDMFKEFVLYQASMRGSDALTKSRARIGRVLEGLGQLAQALRLYVESGAAEDCLRILTSQGMRLLDGGFADEIDFATSMSLGDAYDRDPVVSGLRGLVDIFRGRPQDGDRKLVRAIKSIADAPLKSELTLRLAVHRWNDGSDPLDLFVQYLNDECLEPARRAEGEALLAQYYARNEAPEHARVLVERAEQKMPFVEGDEWQARILFRVAMAHYYLRNHHKARAMLSSAAEIGSRCGMWSFTSRAFQNLSLLSLFFENDSSSSLWFAQQAAQAATRAGDYADLQNALAAILSLETRRGNVERAMQVEKQLGDISVTGSFNKSDYIASSQAHRLAWSRRYAEAQRLFARILDRQAHLPDRAIVRACYAITLSLDGAFKESSAAVTAALAILDGHVGEVEPYGATLFDFAALLLVVAEVAAGRHTMAQRLLKRRLHSDDDAVACMLRAVETVARAGSAPSYVADGLDELLDSIREFGFGGYGKYVRLAAEQLETRQPETKISLTPQELRVIRDLAAGLTPKQIATEMGRSVFTVQTHIKNAIDKFGCHGRTEAIASARKLGLLEELQNEST